MVWEWYFNNAFEFMPNLESNSDHEPYLKLCLGPVLGQKYQIPESRRWIILLLLRSLNMYRVSAVWQVDCLPFYRMRMQHSRRRETRLAVQKLAGAALRQEAERKEVGLNT